jgi:hypothetical protein
MYTCALNGQCEPDPHGRHTLEECTERCIGVESKDVLYLIDQYNLLPVLQRALSDRVEVIRRLTGATVSAEDSWDILFLLHYEMYIQLFLYPQLYDYITSHSDADLPELIKHSGNIYAFQHFHPEIDEAWFAQAFVRTKPSVDELDLFSQQFANIQQLIRDVLIHIV